MSREVDYKPKPIDPDFLKNPTDYPVTSECNGHKVLAEGRVRSDEEGKPYPTALGVHGTHVAVDWEACVADGGCMDVCPVDVFEWYLHPGQKGEGKDKVLESGGPEWQLLRTDKCDPLREPDCIDCMACETACPTLAIKITPGA
ncbi:MAG TPA: ferredoxin family protein [Thermoplasmata archaeon]|nr:ferredoxin family protein [Thermoplasmata archaeon]